MVSLKKLKMRKVTNLLSTKEEVRRVITDLENKTSKSFSEFAKSRRKSWELSHLIFID